MSILTGITGAVRAQIASRLNSAITGVTSATSASASGKPLDIFDKPDKTGKFTTKVMSYPDNVANDPQSGHFILFEVYAFSDGKLQSAKLKKDFDKIRKQIEAEYSTEVSIMHRGEMSDKELTAETNKRVMAKQAAGATAPGGIAKGRKSIIAQMPVKKMPAAISLYMPPSVSVSYDVGYKDSEIGTLAMLGSEAIKAFTSGKSTASSLSAFVDSLGSTGAEGLKSAALSAIDVVAPGAKTLVNLASGKVVTPKMELMFENVGRRNFSFKFDFIPKSAKEAKTIQEIIYTFKENMMPEFVEGSSREMKIPNIFGITYMYHNQENKFINKISNCFLKSIEVTYGGDRFTAYDPIDGSPPPQKSSISLSFGEIEIMSKQMIREGH